MDGEEEEEVNRDEKMLEEEQVYLEVDEEEEVEKPADEGANEQTVTRWRTEINEQKHKMRKRRHKRSQAEMIKKTWKG